MITTPIVEHLVSSSKHDYRLQVTEHTTTRFQNDVTPMAKSKNLAAKVEMQEHRAKNHMKET